MPSQNGNGGRGGPWGSGAKLDSDFEDVVRQGQDRVKQIMQGGGPRRVIVLAVLALLGLGAWTAYYTVPSDSVAVVQRFGKYLKDVRRDCILSCRWASMWQQSFLSNGS